MALATAPLLNRIVRPACKQRREKLVTVIETSAPGTFHKNSMSVLLDIQEKYPTMSHEVYNYKIEKIADMVTCETDSCSIFQTFCQLSFLDRYQDKAIITSAMLDLDKKISRFSLQMAKHLKENSIELLKRLSMIENLTLLDANMVCLLCQLCKTSNQNISCVQSLLEIGRSVWPYLKRPLWHSDAFIDFFSDIFETIGYKLEEMYTNRFSIAWKIIHKNLVTSESNISHYGKLRLLGVVEYRCRNWSLPIEVVELYRKQYKEFSDKRKKEVLAMFGSLSSRRISSLTVKPGRSAADFRKRKQSQEEVDERRSTSSDDSHDASSEEVLKEGGNKMETQSEKMDGRKENGNVPKDDNVIGENTLDKSGNVLPESIVDNDRRDCKNTSEEVGNLWQENENKMEMNDSESLWKKTENEGWKGKEDIRQEIEDVLCDRNGDNFSNKASKNAPENRSFLFDRKKEIIKVPSRYVGRVIGTHGSVISSIQDESGASVHIVRPPREKVGKNEEIVETENEREEYEFQINGTDESIVKARRKIEDIISHTKSLENHATLKRSFSEGDEANFTSFRRSFFQGRKRIIMKVPSKYVGRVIGANGNMIMTIEEESGAKVNFLNGKKAEKHKTFVERKRSTEYKSEDDIEQETERKEDGEKSEQVNEKQRMEMFKEEKQEEHFKENKEKTESQVELRSCHEEETVEGDVTTSPSNEVTTEMVNRQTSEETVDEHDFELCGTDEEIEKAKSKIEYIMKLVDDTEKRKLTRSYSYSFERKSSKDFQRSLSCPIPNWGERCTGECPSCQRMCYCRSFLLERSQSPSCWIRPESLALTQGADWAEFIVKTKVDDRTLWRPTRSNSDTSDDVFSTEGL